MVSVTVLALIVIPAIYAVVKEVAIRREFRKAALARSAKAENSGLRAAPQ
jgi:uncharacterized protein YqgC (DUF456 family)